MIELEELFKKWEKIEYVKGVTDCAFFVAEAFKIQTGKDFSYMFKEKYNSEEELDNWLKDNSFSNLEDAVTKISGITPMPADQAEYGDIVSYSGEGETSIGICKGARVYFVSKVGTMVKVPKRICNLSWRVK
jgi:hypothetical protein